MTAQLMNRKRKVLLGLLGLVIVLAGLLWNAEAELRSRREGRAAAFIGFYQVLDADLGDYGSYPRSIPELKSHQAELFEQGVSRQYGPTFEADVQFVDPGTVDDMGIIAIERSPSRVSLLKSDRLVMHRNGDIEWESGPVLVKDRVILTDR